MNLSSRLSLVASIVLVTGYALAHAAYGIINSTEYQSGAPLTSALFEKVVNNVADLNARAPSFLGGNFGF